MPEYGSIYTQDGATGTAANAVTGIDSTTWTKITGFTAKGPANGISVNADIDELQVQSDAIYYCFCHLSYFGPQGTEVKFNILRDDVATVLQTDEFLDITGTFPFEASVGGHLEFDAGDRVAVGVQFEAGSGEITIEHGQFGIQRVS